MSEEIHIYTAETQPAHDFTDHTFDPPRQVKWKPKALAYCYGCRTRRRLINLGVQCFYDGLRFWCRGGCVKKAKRRKK